MMRKNKAMFFPVLINIKHRQLIFLLSVIGAFLAACTDKNEEVMLPGQDIVLAKVNNTEVTKFDVDRAIKEQLGPGTLNIIDDDTRNKILEGLVVARVFSQEMEKQLNDEQKQEINAAVNAYRELLLAKQFLTVSAKNNNISDEMLQNYYENHLERYGKQEAKYFSLLKGKVVSDAKSKQEIISKLQAAIDKSDEDWKAFNKGDEETITFFSGKLEKNLFEPRLQMILEGLGEQETSNVVFINGVPYVGRVSKAELIEAQPFTEVREDVLKSVQALEIKKASEKLKKDVLAKSEITYTSGKETSSK